ncbi:Gfo/Idh/MocA family protein [Chitinophaga rhizophila]|uniref:Gfo/Idh/MocA family oxidoreductase n=1 Tax=Chitinophaga rhizophila TaxID=2866212 RepID=A0ABS7GAB1_9BACT|nr:Gfo/Idh/MocA family oxidoreductase [Chitinophaga rhizophila]MBW8684589.1 Gfo/Idh/MocA family oxidoreductase [Chitinophaga rhizophila]
MHNTSRRHFLKNAAILSPVLTFLPSYMTAGTGSRLRTGFIGLGPWGQAYLAQALQHRDIDVRAICDTDPAAIRSGLRLFNDAGYSRPDVFEESYTALLSRKDIDAVIIAAPWQLHYEIAKAAMLAGKHVACGAIMGSTIQEHQDIVRISRQTGRQYFMLDEHSYRTDLLTATHMAATGVFGTLESVHAGARHDNLSTAGGQVANSYPVYPALAAARILGVNSTNPYVSLEVVKEKQNYVINSPFAKNGRNTLFFKTGEISTIRLTTKKGQTLSLQMESSLEQPISTGFRINGTNGAWVDLFNSIYLKDQHSASQTWAAGKPYLQQYTQQADLPRYRKPAANNGYAIALQEFVSVVAQPANQELPVYAAAANSMIGPMAQLSSQKNGAVIHFPDLT